MSTQVNSAQLLANGLRNDFWDTYEKVRNRQSDSRLNLVMDLGVGKATNRQHTYGHYKSAPHMSFWERGGPIPTKGMDSEQWDVPIYEWGRRIPWLKWDRKDEQTQSLMQIARAAGKSAARLPERFFFDILQGGSATLPAVPLAPDGVGLFSATDGDGNARFGATGGNTIAGGGVTAAQILTDYYDNVVRYKQFTDTEDEPLFGDEDLESGYIIIHPVELTEAMEEAFIQKRQIGTGGSTPSNVTHDASRRIELWGSPRLTDANNWYQFLLDPPTMATFLSERQELKELMALEDDNNSDSVRTNAVEYMQYESRSGAGILTPHAAIEVTNA